YRRTVADTGVIRAGLPADDALRAARVARARVAAAGLWRPTIFDAASSDGRAELLALLVSGVGRSVDDSIEEQMCELVDARGPARPPGAAERAEGCAELPRGAPLEHYGVWVFYPWSARLVHVLPPPEFRELRTDRNRYKITAAEQARLGRARIGV